MKFFYVDEFEGIIGDGMHMQCLKKRKAIVRLFFLIWKKLN